MKESQLQAQVIKWLRSRGCYVIKCQVPPAPKGCPDIFAVYEGLWLALEVKDNAKSSFQPLQKETLIKLNDWGYAKVVHRDNWPEIRHEIDKML